MIPFSLVLSAFLFSAQAQTTLSPQLIKSLRIEIWKRNALLLSVPPVSPVSGVQPHLATPRPAPRRTHRALPPLVSTDSWDEAKKKLRDFLYDVGDRLVHQSIWRQSPWDKADLEIAPWLKLRGGVRLLPGGVSSQQMQGVPSTTDAQMISKEHWSHEQGDILTGLGIELTQDFGLEFGQYLSPISRFGSAERYDLVLDTRPVKLRDAPTLLESEKEDTPRFYALIRGGIQQLHLDDSDPLGAAIRVESGFTNLSMGRLYILGSASRLLEEGSDGSSGRLSQELLGYDKSWKFGAGYALEVRRHLQVGAEIAYFRGGAEPGTMLIMDEDVRDEGASFFFMMELRF